MRSVTRFSLVLASSAVLVGSMALPASAADTTTTTVTVPSGTIGYSAVPATAAPLSTSAPGTTATVSLAGVQITDNRAGTAGWTATVSMSPLNGEAETVVGTSDNIIQPTAAAYTAGAATRTGTVTVTASAKQSDLTAAQNVQTATAVTGNHTATWTGTLEVAIPSDAIADTYTATLTHSLL